MSVGGLGGGPGNKNSSAFERDAFFSHFYFPSVRITQRYRIYGGGRTDGRAWRSGVVDAEKTKRNKTTKTKTKR